jgi:hypothetical protein
LHNQATDGRLAGEPAEPMAERPAPPPHVALLRVLLAAAIASSAIHYTHNFVMASIYPPLPPMFPNALAFRIGIAIAWPLLTGLALWGYTRYVAGQTRPAGWAFIAYSTLGISTIGHFLGPSPEIPTFFFVTIFTDFLTGTAMLVFGLVTLRQPPVTSCSAGKRAC